jgi:hypothetical protein
MKPPPSPCLPPNFLMANIQMPTKITAGSTQPRRSLKKVFSTIPVNFTSYSERSFASAGSTRVVTNFWRPSSRGFLRVPWMLLSVIEISLISPAFTMRWNSL